MSEPKFTLHVHGLDETSANAITQACTDMAEKNPNFKVEDFDVSLEEYDPPTAEEQAEMDGGSK
jgi:hypothetical protein